MKNFKLAHGLMVALVLMALTGLVERGVAQAGIQSQAVKDVQGLNGGKADLHERAVKDVEAFEKSKADHEDEATKMLSKTVTGASKGNTQTGKGMEKYLPSESDFQEKTNTTTTKLNIGDLMVKGGSQSNMAYKHMPVPGLQNVCCYNFRPCPKKHGRYLDYCRPTKCWGNKKGSAFDIEYWEPSAVIEVSCRSGYSLLKPGLSARGDKSLQSCLGSNKPGNGRRFFEARVWAINGYDGKLRHKSALGGTNGERMRQCSEYKDPGDTNATRYWGYGRNKEGTFSHPDSDGNGPGGSWEAYISDNDPSWAMDNGGASSPATGVCKPGSVDIANCWGSMNPTGWVTHMEPTLAAATVAWRAHTKALGMKKVSGAGKSGYKMMFDYPFQLKGAAANEMGVSGSGKTGSDLFRPGASGPDWFGGLVPELIPDKVGQLKAPKLDTVAEVRSGVYIFTVWVKTSCRRWTVETKGPAGMCKYEDKS